jgi:hypothetical protein
LDAIDDVIEENTYNSFSLLAAALLAGHEQSKASIAGFAAKIARQLIRRTSCQGSWVCRLPPDPRQGKDADKLEAIELMWFTLTLLNALNNPSNLTHDELSFYRERFAAEPRVSRFSTVALDAEAPSASLPGALCDRLGIISGEFVEAAQAEQLIAAADELGAAPSSTEEVDLGESASSGKGVCWSSWISRSNGHLVRWEGLPGPLDVYQALRLIPGLATQTLVAAQDAGDEDLSALIEKFIKLSARSESTRRTFPNLDRGSNSERISQTVGRL